MVLDEANIKTLVVEHKPHFTNDEWKKICWFENQFSKSDDYLSYDFEEIIVLKFSKFQAILSFKECNENWLTIACSEVNERSKRISSAEALNRVEINAAKKHIPYILDEDLLSLLQQYCNETVLSVISFDTTNSKRQNTIQIVIAVTTPNLEHDVTDLFKRAYYYFVRKHNVHIEYAYILLEESLKPFLNGQYQARFHLRDEIETNNLDGILYKWKAEEERAETDGEFGEASLCDSCYKSTHIKPLSLQQFDIFHEWFVEVPIETQLLLEVFINKRRFTKTNDKESYLGHKLEKLFRAYDNLLNIFTKNFIGIFQQVHTNKLLVECKSISSVFDITSTAGTTSNLSYAETNLKTKAKSFEELPCIAPVKASSRKRQLDTTPQRGLRSTH